MPRACCRRPVVPPLLPAQPCKVAAAAPIVVRRDRRSARCWLLSRTTSESARGQPREADGSIAHVGRLKIGTCSAACVRAASRCNLRRERVRSTARVECVSPLPPATAAPDCELGRRCRLLQRGSASVTRVTADRAVLAAASDSKSSYSVPSLSPMCSTCVCARTNPSRKLRIAEATDS